MSVNNYQSVAASGYRTIRNAIDERRYVVHPEIIDEHRCRALIPQVANPSLFANFGPCDNSIMLEHRANGISVQGLGRNTEISSTTPNVCVTEITAGNWAVSQQKIAGIDRWNKCNFDRFWDNVTTKRQWVFDDYIDRIGLALMATVNPCVIDRCGKLDTGTDAEPIDMNVDTSHLLFSYAQNAKFSNCDERGLVMTFPRCFRGVLTGNKEVNDHFRDCCSLEAPQFTGRVPELNGIKVMFSDFVPKKACGDGTFVYTISVFPMGAFGYASLVAHLEQIETDTDIKHFSFAERMLLKYAMGIADPTDYLNFKVKFDLPTLPKTTCGG